MKPIYLAIICFFLLTAGCKYQKPDYLIMLSPAELQEAMQKGNIFLVDVHTPQQRHIKGTDLFVPFNEIEKNKDKLPQDKNAPVYLYCEGGPMGNAAAKTLHELGYQHLFNLDGGAIAWQKAGYLFE